jgi:hypothetical protein
MSGAIQRKGGCLAQPVVGQHIRTRAVAGPGREIALRAAQDAFGRRCRRLRLDDGDVVRRVGPFSAQKTGETAPSAEDQGKGERNFHPFVEMIQLTLEVKTLQSVGIWRERAPQGGK